MRVGVNHYLEISGNSSIPLKNEKCPTPKWTRKSNFLVGKREVYQTLTGELDDEQNIRDILFEAYIIFVYVGKIPSLRQVLLNSRLHFSLVTLSETFSFSRTNFRRYFYRSKTIFVRIDCRWGGLILQNKIFSFLFLF